MNLYLTYGGEHDGHYRSERDCNCQSLTDIPSLCLCILTRRRHSVAVSVHGVSGGMYRMNALGFSTSTPSSLLCDTLLAYMLCFLITVQLKFFR